MALNVFFTVILDWIMDSIDLEVLCCTFGFISDIRRKALQIETLKGHTEITG